MRCWSRKSRRFRRIFISGTCDELARHARHARLSAGPIDESQGCRPPRQARGQKARGSRHAASRRPVLSALDPAVEPGAPGAAGYGVRKAAAGARQHLDFAAAADGATAGITTHGGRGVVAARETCCNGRSAIAAARESDRHGAMPPTPPQRPPILAARPGASAMRAAAGARPAWLWLLKAEASQAHPDRGVRATPLVRTRAVARRRQPRAAGQCSRPADRH